MRVSIIFDPSFQGTAGGAVWIVESATNRQWFERKQDLDQQSAVFTPEGGTVGPSAIVRSIWNAQEHYPEWSEITVSGVPLTTDMSAELEGEGVVRETESGFSLARPEVRYTRA